ncbi:MAG: hypothetical protein FJ138_03355 [Deltaproteobacteria bacterium]|nr:hypothetical protein [Deltaproteobacteria bacterium]
MSDLDAESAPPLPAERLKRLRSDCFSALRREVQRWSAEAVDMAWAYYPPAEQLKVIADRVLLPKARCAAPDFLSALGEQWWAARAAVVEREGDAPVAALCGFYGRYLPATGFHLVAEFGPAGLAALWRVDARARGAALKPIGDEQDFYDQLGCFLDLHYGWRWVLGRHLQTRRLVAVEVQPGYMIGARRGDPSHTGDFAEREDPEVEEAFSRFDAERFDTLELLNGDEAAEYPFGGERFDEWLPAEWAALARAREVELFTLSSVDGFVKAVEDLAEVRKVEVELLDPEGDARLRLHRGPVSLTRPLSLPYLWTLHSGRTFEEGAIEFFRDDAERVRAASELLFGVREALKPHPRLTARVEGARLLLREGARDVAEAPLLTWAPLGAFEGPSGPGRLLTLLGVDLAAGAWRAPRHPLDRCPLCDAPAQLSRAVRPRPTLPDAPPRAHFVRPEVWGYYALSCAHHHLPISWLSPAEAEDALRAQSHLRLDVRSEVEVEGARLLWGAELAGALLDESGREALRDRGALHAYAFYPDLVALSLVPLAGAALDAARARGELMAAQLGPDRAWALGWATPLS